MEDYYLLLEGKVIFATVINHSIILVLGMLYLKFK